jgi:CheY-like chemotaxis protein
MPYVLIVDDDLMMAETIASMVNLFDWETRIVHSPRRALEVIEMEPPALILLDVNMHGIDAFEVLRYIKRDPVAQETPVVFVSDEDAPPMRERAREVGASDYLVKPVDIDRLEVILDNLARLS